MAGTLIQSKPSDFARATWSFGWPCEVIPVFIRHNQPITMTADAVTNWLTCVLGVGSGGVGGVKAGRW